MSNEVNEKSTEDRHRLKNLEILEKHIERAGTVELEGAQDPVINLGIGGKGYGDVIWRVEPF